MGNAATIVTAAAYLISEALKQGIEINQLLSESRAAGDFTDAQWTVVMASLSRSIAAWNAASDPTPED